MQVKILSDIFNQASNIDGLNNLLVFFRQERHRLLLDTSADIDAFNTSAWKSELNSRDVKLINEYIRASTRKEKSKITISISDTNTQINFSIQEAYLYLNQPLVILVENIENDSPFINAIIRNFDNSGDLEKAKQEQWWKYGMGSGSSLEQVINSELKNSFNNPIFTKSKKKYLRYFVIMDSDKKYPTMTTPPSKTRFLEDNEVKYHVLYKREQENYMPDIILKDFNDTYLNLYMKFKKKEQKDFFDLEEGFKNKNRTDKDWTDENWINIATLYNIKDKQSISDEDWKILRKGIQIEEYKKGKFKSEFPKKFNSPKVTKDSLLEMIKHQPQYDGLNEFEHIITEIKKLL